MNCAAEQHNISVQAQKELRNFIDQHSWRHDVFSAPIQLDCDSEILSQFMFCLLGGYGITYEMNLAAHEYLRSTPGLNRDSLLSSDFTSKAAKALKQLPVKSPNGNRLVSYRFPNSKASTLRKAAEWIDANSFWDMRVLYNLTPISARETLLDCPGVGYKTASWFLRNIGHGTGLAIIDVHLERMAIEWALIPVGLDVTRDYIEIESRLRFHCDAIGCELSEVDLGIWKYSRGDIVDHITGQLNLF